MENLLKIRGQKSVCTLNRDTRERDLPSPSLFQHITMPSPRKAFANKLNANRMKNGQLSNKQKNCIISDRLNGQKPSVLAVRYSCHRNTVTKLFN